MKTTIVSCSRYFRALTATAKPVKPQGWIMNFDVPSDLDARPRQASSSLMYWFTMVMIFGDIRHQAHHHPGWWNRKFTRTTYQIDRGSMKLCKQEGIEGIEGIEGKWHPKYAAPKIIQNPEFRKDSRRFFWTSNEQEIVFCGYSSTLWACHKLFQLQSFDIWGTNFQPASLVPFDHVDLHNFTSPFLEVIKYLTFKFQEMGIS